MVVTVCGVPEAVVTENTSTSAPAAVYSVPTEFSFNDSVREKSGGAPINSGKNTGV
jgi:hypothetical protein